MKIFGKISQQTQSDRIRVYKDFYDFNKTVSHGFPANPSCLAFDNHHKLLAIGTKNGSVQIYGKPGVEFHYQFKDETKISHLIFVSSVGRLICLCSDNSLHLLKIPSQRDQKNTVEKLNSNYNFVPDQNLNNSLIITTISLNCVNDTLLVGFKNGDIQVLDVQKNFSVKDKSISQEQVTKSIEAEVKLNPGSVEVIQEQPNNLGKFLIGYSRCLIALWNYANDLMENYFIIEQQLENLSWDKDGDKFITAHNDGSYIIWTANQTNHHFDNSSSKLPYGPFPCKAIKKILWSSTAEGQFVIFSGGMPRASYSEKEAVCIIFQYFENQNNENEKNHVLDFTSKVIDFLLISNNDELALVVLAEEEIVVIDLQHDDWLQFSLPYLNCLHSSPITCSQHYSDIPKLIYDKISECGKFDQNIKYSSREWPINGGISKYQNSNIKFDLLITGHEDGTIRFWDASATFLKHLCTLSTSKYFNLNDDDIALIDSEENDLDENQSEWPPFRKVGTFDPYSDDPRLAIRKISFSLESCNLLVGGTAGQIIAFHVKEEASDNYVISVTDLKIIDEKDSFIWKGHSCLPIKCSKLKFNIGFQPSSIIQVHPPAAITALVHSTKFQLFGAGTAHGFGLYDFSKKIVLLTKSTLKQSNMSSVVGGDALISRRKSFKKSLRESFRRLRRSRSQKNKSYKESNKNITKYNEETRPIERQVEAKPIEDGLSSMVRYVYFCSAPVLSANTINSTFWVGTNGGTVLIYVLISNQKSEPYWQLCKEVQLRHKAPIVFIKLVDSNWLPVQQQHIEEPLDRLINRVLICSEEQFKMFSLPNLKPIFKFKLTASEGSRVRKMDSCKFVSKSNENQFEYSLICLTNIGEINIFSYSDFKRKFQNYFIKKEDINGISSLIFTKNSEGFYLKSSSEYQRFSLSSKQINFPECFVQILENQTEPKNQE